MATREVLTLTCDRCKSPTARAVETHSLALDGRAVEVEACAGCWSKVEKAVAGLLEAGRRVRAKRRA